MYVAGVTSVSAPGMYVCTFINLRTYVHMYVGACELQPYPLSYICACVRMYVCTIYSAYVYSNYVRTYICTTSWSF